MSHNVTIGLFNAFASGVNLIGAGISAGSGSWGWFAVNLSVCLFCGAVAALHLIHAGEE